MCHGDDREPPIGFRVVAKKGPKFITKIGGSAVGRKDLSRPRTTISISEPIYAAKVI